jgi:hypothetical protein
MKTKTIVVMTAVLLMSLSMVKSARADEGSTGFFAGKIELLNVPLRTLQVRSEESAMMFVVAADAKIIGADQRELMLADLRLGDEVTVDYVATENVYVARTITVKPEPSRPPWPSSDDPVPIQI